MSQPVSSRSSRSAEFDAVDWQRWTPALDATLLFVVVGDQMLMIEKKRGLGAGKINAAGGKVDPGETPLQAAQREFEEELIARPLEPRKLGEIAFEVLDGPSIRIHVFRSDEIRGEPQETEEAIPVWAPLDDLPFDRMWADDRYWLPLLVEDRPFRVRTVFRGDALLGYEVIELDDPPA